MFDPKGFQQFQRLFPYHDAAIKVGFVIGIEDLIDAATGNGRSVLAAIVDQNGKIIGLQRFIERTGRLIGHALAVFGDQKQLGFAPWRGFLLSHCTGKPGKAGLIGPYPFYDRQHRMVEVAFIHKFWIQWIQLS